MTVCLPMIAGRQASLHASNSGGPAPVSSSDCGGQVRICSSRNDGFTLLEVIVALAILGAGLLGLFELLSGSLRLSGGARDVTAASLYASQRMEEALLAPGPVEGVETGLFGDKYRWTKETAFLPEEEGLPFRPVRIQVTIRWDDGAKEKTVSLSGTRWDMKSVGAGG